MAKGFRWLANQRRDHTWTFARPSSLCRKHIRAHDNDIHPRILAHGIQLQRVYVQICKQKVVSELLKGSLRV